jgi:hypothetical protein
MRSALALLLPVLLAPACVGTTGGSTVSFSAAAAGPSDATGESLVFTTDKGWAVTLTKARLHVGAVYLDQSVPLSGAGVTACILPGTYVAQVTSPVDVDLLSATPVRFPTPGQGITGSAAIAQVWLTGGDVNAKGDATHILELAGTATLAGDVRPFTGVVTIGENRETQGTLAGADPPCKERIVPVPTNVEVQAAGGLLVRIDPRELFPHVDFTALTKPEGFDSYVFQDNSNDPASANLYSNLHAGGSLYSFYWSPDL